jgi:hypothetical protein
MMCPIITLCVPNKSISHRNPLCTIQSAPLAGFKGGHHTPGAGNAESACAPKTQGGTRKRRLPPASGTMELLLPAHDAAARKIVAQKTLSRCVSKPQNNNPRPQKRPEQCNMQLGGGWRAIIPMERILLIYSLFAIRRAIDFLLNEMR